ncbi:M24 family metallopeptidase, partial [Neobacillus niacini]|uniref:M24 family metallopeptidase n=1 Tax=Neobacillus niacini TaxID=86668 RepID=UPI0030016960
LISMIFTLDEYQLRWERVYIEMEKRGFDSCVIWSGASYDRVGDVLWLTNYASGESGQIYESFESLGHGFAAVIMRSGHEPELHIAEPIGNINLQSISTQNVHGHPNLSVGICKRLRELEIKGKVAYVGGKILPISFYQELTKAIPSIEWIPVEDLLFNPKLIKSKQELEVFREGGEIVSKAHNVLMESLIACESEAEAASKASREILRYGGGFYGLAVNHGSGNSDNMFASNSLYGFSTTTPKSGDIVRGWIYGPILHGYWLDIGRTAVAGGKPSYEQKQLIEASVNIMDEVLKAVRPGVTPRQVAKKGYRIAEKQGYYNTEKDSSVSILGHGLGTYLEPPMITVSNSINVPFSLKIDDPYEEGIILTVEVFLNQTGVGTVAQEQNCIVTKNGFELLTTSPLIYW